MSLSITELLSESLTDPLAATRRIIGLGLSTTTLWQTLFVAIIVTVLLEQAVFWISASGVVLPDPSNLTPPEAQILEMTRFYAENPLFMVVLQLGIAAVAVGAITLIGRVMGGQGNFEDALAMIAWFQVILLLLQIAQTVVAGLFPPMGGLLALATLLIFFYLLTMFVAELHGFENTGMVFAMIIVSLVGLAALVAVVLAIFGVTFLPELPNA